MALLQLSPPNEKQKLFLLDRHKHVAFGGARGGGKSFAVRYKAALLCLKHAGITCMIVRKSYPELTENHIKPMRALLKTGTRDAIAKYNDSKKEMIFPNGSQILFRYCDKDADVDRYQGTEVDVLFLDEATQLSEEQIKKLVACVRGVNAFPKRIYYTCNPGGKGHGYIKRLFIDRKYEAGEVPEEYSFIQSLVQDNAALMKSDPEYIRQLEALPPKIREAWLYGNWDIFEGQFFEEFKDDPEHYEDRCWTHVIEPFEIPAGWKIYRSYDFGYSKPFSVGWWAVDYDGRLYRILELYGCTSTPNEGVKWTPDEQFRKIREVEQQHPYLKGRNIRGVADPAIWEASSGQSVAETAAKYQIYFEKGDHKRLAGWMQVHYRLAFDEQGIPMMYVFNTCKAFIRTIPLMMYDEHAVEDLDTDLEDHVADEVRYMCMDRPIKPVVVAEKKPIGEDPLNQRIPKRRMRYIGGQR